MVRDPFTGRVYVELRTGGVLELDPDAALRGTFATPTRLGRISLSPDGGLYHVEVLGADTTGALVERWELPTTR